jgi:hypothetical protein
MGNMKLTKEEKKLKEAMKIILRDGKSGHLYNVAIERYKELYTPERIENLAREIDDVDWTTNYNDDVKAIQQYIES